MQGADRRRFVARHDELGGSRREAEPALRHRGERLAEEIAGFERLQGALADGRFLPPEAGDHRAAKRVDRQAEESRENAQAHEIFRSLRARIRRQLSERQFDPDRVRAESEVLGGARDGIGLVRKDDGVLRGQDLAFEAGEVGPAEDDEDVDGVAGLVDRVRAEPDDAGRLAAPDLRAVGLRSSGR